MLTLQYGGRSTAGLSGALALGPAAGRAAHTNFLKKKHEDEMRLRYLQLYSGAAQQEANRMHRAESQMRAQDFRAQENAYNRQFQADSQIGSQDFRAQENAYNRQFQAQENAYNRQFQEQQNLLPYQQQQALEQAYLEQEQQRAQSQQILDQGVQEGMLYYTPAQKSEMARLDDAISKLPMDPKYSDEAKQEAMMSLQARRDQIIPSVRPADQRPVPLQAQLSSSVNNYEQYQHLPWTLGENGEAQLPRNFGPDDAAKREDARAKWIQQRSSMTHEDGSPLFTPERVNADADVLFPRLQQHQSVPLVQAEAEPPPEDPNYREQSFDSQEAANLWAARQKARGWKADVTPGPRKRTQLVRDPRTGKIRRAEVPQSYIGIASREAESREADFAEATMSLKDFVQDKGRRASAQEVLFAEIDRMPTEMELTQRLVSDYYDHRDAMAQAQAQSQAQEMFDRPASDDPAYSPEAARSDYESIKKKYPNLQSLDQMSKADREKLHKAIKTLRGQ